MPIALLLGSDSFLASASLGPALAGRTARLRLALAFALCDGLASAAGAALGWHAAWAPLALAAPAVLLAMAALLLVRGAAHRAGGAPRWIYLVPLLLSLDNLFAGAAAAGPASPALAQGLGAFVSSASLALAGIALGGLVAGAIARGRPDGARRASLASAALLCLSAALLLG